MSNWGNARSEGGKAGHQGGGNSSTGAFSGPDFNNLYLQKRSTDQESLNRRKSISEQYSSGYFSRLWRRWMSGPGGDNMTVSRG